MSCIALSSTIKDCNGNLGGLKEVWIARTEDKLSLTSTYNMEVQSMGLTGTGEFTKLEFSRNSASYDVGYSVDGNGVASWKHSVSLTVNKRVADNMSAIRAFLDGDKDLTVMVLDNQDQWRLLGWDYGLNSSSANGGIGASKSAGSAYSISLSGTQDKPEYLVDLSAAQSVIPTA